MAVTKRRFEGHGLSLTADAMGEDGDESVILLHGGGQTRASWGKALEVIASNGFYGLSIDLRGHGESDWAPDRDYRLDAHSADLRAVIAQLDQTPFVVGASLGGLIGLLLAGEHTDLIRGLVLVDVVPRLAVTGTRRITDFMTARPDGFDSVEEAVETVAAFLPHRPRPATADGLLKNLRLREDGRYYWHWDSALMSGENLSDPNGTDLS